MLASFHPLAVARTKTLRTICTRAFVVVVSCWALLAQQTTPTRQTTPTADSPVFAFVGLHGGVFEQLQQQAAALPVRVEYLQDERIASREVDFTRYRLIFVQHLREDTGPVLAEGLLTAQKTDPRVHAFALSGGGTRPRQLTEKPEHKELLERDPDLQAYYGSSADNLRRLLIYALTKYCAGTLPIEPPLPAPTIGIYHPDLGGPVDLAAFEQYLASRGAEFAARPRVVVIAHNIHMQLQQPAVIEALVRGCEQRGLAACAVLDTGEGLARFRADYEKLLALLHPEVAIHTCHAVDTLELRESLDIPHVHSIFLRKQSIAEWQADARGLAPHEIAFQIATQETLGAIEPQVGAGTLHGGGSEEAMLPIPERIDHLLRRVRALVELRRTPNAQKRVAVLYWDSGLDKRGLARGTATGMFLNAPQSLVVLLQRLQSAGYGVQNAPPDEDALIDRMLAGGRGFLPNNRDGLAAAVKNGKPALISVTRFTQWLEQRLSPAARQQLVERWGPPPGRFMVWHDEHGEAFLVVPHVDFGNVVLLPQALRGEAYDSATAHDRFAAPPYNYLATYFWLQEEWRAQAMVHFGTHGSDIALPGKAVGLGADDWTDICMGDLPNIYPWIVENLGEAPAAKRRSYGVLIGHLPPPVVNAGLGDDLKTLHDDLEKMLGLDAGALRERFRAQVSEQARKLRLDADLGITFAKEPLDDVVLGRIDDHLHTILEQPIPTSLHTLGEVPTDEQLVPHLVTCLHKAFLDRLAALLPEEPGSGPAGGHLEHLRDHAESLLRAAVLEGQDDRSALAAAGFVVPTGGVPEKLAADLATARQMRDGYQKTGNELDGIVEALAGRFISPGPGRGPDRNPSVLPTGRNLYLLNQDEVPSKASWELGSKLADDLLAEWQRDHGRLPKKIAFTLSSHATFQDYGVMESQILRLLGAEPIWNERNLVKDVRIVPRGELGRPRIDVMISSGGRYYASLPSRMELLERTLRLVQQEEEADNGVRAGTATMLTELRRRGLPADQARKLASARIFGYDGYDGQPAKFSYLVERSADWDSRDELMEQYMTRSRAAFVDGDFVTAPRAAYETVLQGTEVVLRTWARSTESPLSNRYQWLQGGTLAAAVEYATGTRPEFRLVDVRDPDRASNVDSTLAVRRDFRARLFNRKWIAGMQTEGYAGADQVAVHVGNAFGWETMQKGTVTKELWDEIAQVYLQDSMQMGMNEWFRRENPHAQQAIASVLLDAARKGFWQADAELLAQVADFYLASVQQHGGGDGLRDAGTGKIRRYAESVGGPQGTVPAVAAATTAVPPPPATTDTSPTNTSTNAREAASQAPVAAKPDDAVATERVTGQRLTPVAANEPVKNPPASTEPDPSRPLLLWGIGSAACLLLLCGFVFGGRR